MRWLIVDLHIRGGLAIVVGTGAEGMKKIDSLLTQECDILVVGKSSNARIAKYAKNRKIKFVKADLHDAKFLSEYNKPVLVMATTDDAKLNRKIAVAAKKIPGCMAYASDDPDFSDFAHPSVINIMDTVQVTVSTGGRSPAMAREIRTRVEKSLKDAVTKEDIAQINLQQWAREAAKKSIAGQVRRKKYLYRIMRDLEVSRLIKQGKIRQTRKRAMDILEDFK